MFFNNETETYFFNYSAAYYWVFDGKFYQDLSCNLSLTAFIDFSICQDITNCNEASHLVNINYKIECHSLKSCSHFDNITCLVTNMTIINCDNIV